MPKELAAMLLQAESCLSALQVAIYPDHLQVVEEEETFSVHVYRERQDVSLRVLTEPFWLFCHSARPQASHSFS